MVGRNFENANETRAYIKTRTLLGRGSMDKCTVYGSSSMSFLGKEIQFSEGSVTSAPKSGRSKSASSPKTVKSKKFSKIRRKIILLSRLRTNLEFQKHILRILPNILIMSKESTRWTTHMFNEEQICTHVRTARKLLKRFPIYV